MCDVLKRIYWIVYIIIGVVLLIPAGVVMFIFNTIAYGVPDTIIRIKTAFKGALKALDDNNL